MKIKPKKDKKYHIISGNYRDKEATTLKVAKCVAVNGDFVFMKIEEGNIPTAVHISRILEEINPISKKQKIYLILNTIYRKVIKWLNF